MERVTETLGDAGQPARHRTDLSRFDPVAADLDLVIGATLDSGSRRGRRSVRDRRTGSSDARRDRSATMTKRSAVRSGRPMYPWARLRPPRYSSPTSPTATDCPCWSRSSTSQFEIGVPIGGRSGHACGSPSSRYAVTTCVSDGPYWLSSVVPGRAAKTSRRALSTRSCSPAVITSVSDAGRPAPCAGHFHQAPQCHERQEQPLDTPLVEQTEKSTGIAPVARRAP